MYMYIYIYIYIYVYVYVYIYIKIQKRYTSTSQYFPEQHDHSVGNVKVELDPTGLVHRH